MAGLGLYIRPEGMSISQDQLARCANEGRLNRARKKTTPGKHASKKAARKKAGKPGERPVGLRIIGGKFRGRRLEYHGDKTVRPMKDRVRESMFNLLGPGITETVALDLFAGTGALGLEALSRGTPRAVFVERHYPTAHVLQDNIRSLGLEAQAEVIVADSFFWWDRDWRFPSQPVTLFLSPPWPLYAERPDDFFAMITRTLEQSAWGSRIGLEADRRLDLTRLPDAENWAIREYPPAILAVYRKDAEADLPPDLNETEAGDSSL